MKEFSERVHDYRMVCSTTGLHSHDKIVLGIDIDLPEFLPVIWFFLAFGTFFERERSCLEVWNDQKNLCSVCT